MLFVIIVLHSEFLRPQAEGCQPSGRCHGGEMMRTGPVKKAGILPLHKTGLTQHPEREVLLTV
jgi:hypothetical protein